MPWGGTPMLIPAIGEVPNWLIAYSAVAAVLAVFIIKKFLSSRVRNIETCIDASLLDIKNLFVNLSKFVRGLQVDTINDDTTILAFGIVLIFLIYLVVMLW